MVKFVPEADSVAGRFLKRLGKLLGLRSETVYSRAIILLTLMLFVVVGVSVSLVWQVVFSKFEAEDELELRATAERLKLSLEGNPLSTLPENLAKTSLLLGQKVYWQATSEKSSESRERILLQKTADGSRIAIFSLGDADGMPHGEVVVTGRRSFNQAGEVAARIFVVVVAVVGGVMLLLMLFVVDRTVLARIQLLADKVENEKRSERLPVRLDVPGDDEIAQLATSMEDLARLVQNTEREYRTSEILAAKKLEESQHQLALLSARLVHLQDQERRRIARELHDSTAQSLSALEMNMSVLQSLGGNAKARQLAEEAGALCRQVCQELRNISYLLHPPLLEEEGLPFAIRWFADGFTKRNNIPVILDFPDDFPRLDDEIETAFFRIVQESFRNIYRHSGANKAWVTLRTDEHEVFLEVRDNGKGLPEGFSLARSAGVGLAGTHERMKQLGGTFKVTSSEYGVSVQCRLQSESLKSPL